MKRLLTITTFFILFSNAVQAQCDATFTAVHATCDSLWFYPVSTGSQYTYSWDFGDGFSSNSMYATHEYSSDGTYYVILNITDTINGCTDAYTYPLTIDCGACTVNADFAWVVDTSNCSVQFTSTAFGGTAPYSYEWNFGDGNTGTQAHPSHTYPPNSTWTPCLTVTDAMGCDTSYCDVVNVFCATSCDAAFSAVHATCDSLWFYPVSTGSQYTYSWDFGDGFSSNSMYATHEYSSDGTYYVILNITDTINGCTDAYTYPLTIDCGACTVNADFAWVVDTSNCSVQFTSTAFGGMAPYSYEWNFGDGNTSTQAHPSHTYPSNSTWTPCLTVTDAMGCDTSYCDVVNVFCATSCDAAFSAVHATCDSLWFYPVSTGSQYTYSWDFGDGFSSNSMYATHEYSSDGTYYVILNITDTINGCTDAYTYPLTIDCGACTVNADFAWVVDTSNCSVQFTSTAFGGMAPYSYEWNFGDGNTSTQAHPSHTYPSNSTWTPCLTVTDAMGCDTSYCDVVNVFCATSCDAAFSAVHATCDSLWFYPVSTGSQYTYSWDFGDGFSSNSMYATHEYSSDGTYYVILNITDTINGCTDAYTYPLTIDCGACTVNADFAWVVDTSNCSVQFTSTAFGGTAPYSYEWNFGDGNTGTQAHPSHTYPPNSTWTPCLTVTDAMGCDTSYCDVVNVFCATNSINGEDDQYTITIYPNPGDGNYFIELEEMTEIEVFDVSGKLIFNDQSADERYYLDLTAVQRGMYIIRLSMNDGAVSQRLIKN
ncbi:MAG: PKD domain-containing protein [Crocinitomicaceae bacterium]